MLLAQCDDVVDVSAMDRSNQGLAKEYCHGEPGAMCSSQMPMARKTMCDGTTVDPVPIADQISEPIMNAPFELVGTKSR